MRFRAPRTAANHPVTVRIATEKAIARLLSVSATGVRIGDVSPLTPGSEVTLTIPTGALTARVVWHKGGQAGLRFARPLTPKEVEALRSPSGGAQGMAAHAAPRRGYHGFREMN